MKVKIFLLIISAQLLSISILLYQIYQRSHTLGVSIYNIDSELIQESNSTTLKHFYEPKPNTINEIYEKWLPTGIKNTINADSLNERINYTHKKDEGVFRIVALGDSVTYGVYINTNENWVELLEDYLNLNNNCKKIKKIEVINLGVYGYDTAYEIERYIRRGVKYSPDLIIALIVDFMRVTDYRLKNQNSLNISKSEKDKYKEKGIFYPESMILANQLTSEYKSNYQKINLDRLTPFLTQKIIFFDMEKKVETQRILNSIQNKNIMYQTINLESNAEYYFPDGHPNTIGHQKIMQEIFGHIKNKNLIPCESTE